MRIPGQAVAGLQSGGIPLAPVEASVFLRGPSPLLSPGLEVGLGSPRQEDPPGGLKVGAPLVEASSGRRYTRLASSRVTPSNLIGRSGPPRGTAEVVSRSFDIRQANSAAPA